MEWLVCETDEKILKSKYGTLANLIKEIKLDTKELLKGYESKDKNIIEMFKITSNSWKGIVDKIKIFKEVIKILNINIYGQEGQDLKTSTMKVSKDTENDDEFFKSEEARIIFYLTEADGPKRAKALKITRRLYGNKEAAQKWRRDLSKKIHPDVCNHKSANKAISKLNQLYEEMIING